MSHGDDRARADWLVGGGEMAKFIKAMDWSRTPLGSIDAWPQSLRTTVSLAQASNSPISLAWGEGHVQIYNDGYWPICGAKHPTAMGQDFRECWASAFPVLNEAYQSAWAGKSAYLEKVRMFLDRYGFLEETWFTFSFSPITGEAGDVAGLFHPVTELTAQMLSERRARVLRELASMASEARTISDAYAGALHALGEANLDVPFAVLYEVDDLGESARWVGQTGLVGGQSVRPEEIDLLSDSPWQIGEVVRSGALREFSDLSRLIGQRPVGPYPEQPRHAFALPLRLPGRPRPAAVLVAGISARLPLDDAYRDFIVLLAAGVSSALGNARGYEDARAKAEALAQIDRAKTAFFSNVSHEFRTPLTLILGPLEDELAVGTLRGASRERLETAHRNSLRLLKLVNTLLDFSRIEAGRVEAHYAPTDLASLTSELASAFRSAFERAGLGIDVACQPLSEPVYVDRDMWEKIVLNLLSNALKHTFEGGVRVRQGVIDGQLVLTVSDTGVGIPEAELPRLFERFHRVNGARSRSHEGTGIGLALIQELVALHQGAVEVNSAEGVGTTFTVRLALGHAHLPVDKVGVASAPRASLRAREHVEEALQWLPTEPEDDALSDARQPASLLASEGVERARVLLADDNADMRAYVRRLLSERYEVSAFPDGEQALQAALAQTPDLVLSDVMMPVRDGFRLLEALRADERTTHVPVILLSARAGEEAAIEGLSAGADDYLAKPFSAKELLARVRTHLELARERQRRARQLELANDELSAFTYSVSHDLRAPLRAIDGFSKVLLRDYGERFDELGRHYLTRVRAGSQRMAQLIDDLLSLSRIGRAQLRREPIDLSALAQDVAGELASRDTTRRVTFDVSPDLRAHGDPRLVTVALENLLGNAFKFTGKVQDARISVGMLSHAEDGVFFVRDNGSGFDMEFADKLFTPFHRLHAEEEYEGTGIGLATVQRIVARHGGRIWADAEVGRGATFFFTLGDDA